MRDGHLRLGEWRLDGESDARSFVKKHRLRDQIGGAFTLRVDRELVIHHAATAAIEIVLEQIRLRGGDQSELIFEVQFHLREGQAEDLVRLVAEALPQVAPQPAASLSLVERGYALCGLTSPRHPAPEAAKLDKETLHKDLTVAEAFVLMTRATIDQALALAPPLDGPSVAQNLQAMRRVQSAFRLFASLGPGAGRERDAPLRRLRGGARASP